MPRLRNSPGIGAPIVPSLAPRTAPLICVAGVPAAGKTTWATALAHALGAPLAAERFDPIGNPFLAPYYASPEGRRRYALPKTLAFLMQQVAELRTQRPGAAPCLVQDHAMAADLAVFVAGDLADGVLTRAEYDLIHQVLAELAPLPALAPPTITVALDGPLRLILARLRERGRPDELAVPEAYWAGRHARYTAWLATAPDVLRVDLTTTDLVRDPAVLGPVVDQVRQILRATTARATRPARPLAGGGLR